MNKTATIIISIAFIISSSILGNFFVIGRTNPGKVKATGFAKKQYVADTVKWNLKISKIVPRDEVSNGYKKIEENIKQLKIFLKENSINEDEINLNPVNSFDNYNRQGEIAGYRIEQQLYIISKNIDEIENIAFNPAKLSDKGIFIKYSNLEYYYSDLDSLKIKMLADAAKNAKLRAEETIKYTDNKIDKIISMNTGVFQITQPYSNRVASYGIHNTNSRKKEIKVTVHAEYKLK